MADDEITSSIGEEILKASVEEINSRCRLLDNEIKILEQDSKRINGEKRGVEERIKENNEKIKLNKQLPYLVGNIVEILELKDDDDVEDDGANVDLDSHRKGKCTVEYARTCSGRPGKALDVRTLLHSPLVTNTDAAFSVGLVVALFYVAQAVVPSARRV